MYVTYYGLREKPFDLVPDPRFLYLSAYHREALAGLAYGVRFRKGFMALVGEPGSGKTTIIKHLLGSLGSDVRTIFVFNTDLTFDELLRCVLRELDMSPPREASRDELLHLLHGCLLAEYRAGKSALLIIDEAQNLTARVLEDIRMLGNLETGRGQPLGILLVGQVGLWRLLTQANLHQLRQRLAVVCHLRPLTHAETSEYVIHRLSVVGGKGSQLLTKGALWRIWRHAGGNPRTINRLCDAALLYGFAVQRRRVTARMVGRVVRLQQVPRTIVKRRVAWRRLCLPLGGLAAAGALLFAGTTGFSGLLGRNPNRMSDTHQSVSQPPSPPVPMARPAVYEVRHGDSLAKVAAAHYGVFNYQVLDLVRQRNPDLGDVDAIRPGTRVVLPPLSDATAVRAREDGMFDVLALGTLSDAQAEQAMLLLEQSGQRTRLVPVRVSERTEWLEVLVVGVASADEARRLATDYQQREWPTRFRAPQEPATSPAGDDA